MSQNIPLTSFPESKAWHSVLYKYVSWLTVESPGVNPDWKGVKILLSTKWLCKCLNTSLSRTLSRLLRREMGRWFETRDTSPPLGTGVTWASLNAPGTSPSLSDVLKNIQRAGENSLATSRRMRSPFTVAWLQSPAGFEPGSLAWQAGLYSRATYTPRGTKSTFKILNCKSIIYEK